VPHFGGRLRLIGRRPPFSPRTCGRSAPPAKLAVRRVVTASAVAKNWPVGCGGLTFLTSFALPRRGQSDAPKPSADDEFELARARLRAGCCHRCGNEIEEGLARLASVLCYDCRAAMGVIGLTR
jgi:hypothetical protein